MKQPKALSQLIERFVDAIAAHPFLSVGLGLLLVVASAVGLYYAHADFTHKSFFWDNDPYLQQFDAFERRFGNDDTVIVAMHSPSGIFDMESAQLLQELTDQMWQVPEIIRVDSLSNYNWVRAEGDEIIVEPLFPKTFTTKDLRERKRVALSHEVIPDYLVSRDATTALIFGRVKPGLREPPNAPVITRAVHDMLDTLKKGDHSFYVTGSIPLTNAFQEVAIKDIAKLFPLAVLTATVLLFLISRSVVGTLVTLLVAFLSIIASFGFSGWARIPLNYMSPGIPSIIIAISVADSLHILMSYFQARRRKDDERSAARYALIKNFLPTFLTTVTTAVGFVTFVTADLKPVSGLAMMAAFGTVLAWILTYLILGPILVMRPLRPSRVSSDLHRMQRSQRFATFLLRRRGTIMFLTGAVAVVAATLSFSNEVNSDPLKYFGEDVPYRMANEFVEREVGGVRGMEVIVDSGQNDGIKDPVFMRKTSALQEWISDLPLITRTVSLVDILKETNRSLHRDEDSAYRVPDNREAIGQELFLYSMNLPQGMNLNDRMTLASDALRMTVLTRIPTSREIVTLMDEIEAKGRDLGLSVHVTGKFALYQRTNEYVVNSFLVSFGLAVLMIGSIMVITLRSLRLGVVAMIPNVLPILIGGGFLRLIGQPLDTGTVLVASASLGIAVDDTVHILSNFNRSVEQGKSRFQALTDVFANKTPALIGTTAILITTFATFTIGDFTPNLYFGLLTAVVLGAALLVDLTLTPLLLVPKTKATDAESKVRINGQIVSTG